MTNFIFLGRGGLLSSIVLHELCSNGQNPRFVVIEKKQDSNYPNLLKKVCENYQIKHVITDNPNSIELINKIKNEDIEFALVSGFSTILKEEILSSCKFYNIHPGSLPEYKGANPIFWAIKNNESFFGVSCHEMVLEIDAGKIKIKENADLKNIFNSSYLYRSIYHKCAKMALEFITKYSFYKKDSVYINVDKEVAKYYPKIKAAHCIIDPCLNVDYLFAFINRIQLRKNALLKNKNETLKIRNANLLFHKNSELSCKYKIYEVGENKYIIENNSGIIELTT